MRFFSTLLVGASALASVVSAQAVSFTWSVPASVQVGQTYNVTYQAAQMNSPVTIILRKGVSTNLDTIDTLTSTATGGTFQWTPKATLVNGADYALQIKQGTSENYSKQFALSGSTAVASSSASSSASASASSSASGSSSSASATTLSSSVSSNSTITASSSGATKTGASTTGSAASATGSKTASSTAGAPTTGAANNIKSPLALVFGAVAAMAYLH